jgi:hypothetical protein
MTKPQTGTLVRYEHTKRDKTREGLQAAATSIAAESDDALVGAGVICRPHHPATLPGCAPNRGTDERIAMQIGLG